MILKFDDTHYFKRRKKKNKKNLYIHSHSQIQLNYVNYNVCAVRKILKYIYFKNKNYFMNLELITKKNDN